jgi:hypothetical protein
MAAVLEGMLGLTIDKQKSKVFTGVIRWSLFFLEGQRTAKSGPSRKLHIADVGSAHMMID